MAHRCKNLSQIYLKHLEKMYEFWRVKDCQLSDDKINKTDLRLDK